MASNAELPSQELLQRYAAEKQRQKVLGARLAAFAARIREGKRKMDAAARQKAHNDEIRRQLRTHEQHAADLAGLEAMDKEIAELEIKVAAKRAATAAQNAAAN